MKAADWAARVHSLAELGSRWGSRLLLEGVAVEAAARLALSSVAEEVQSHADQ